MLWIYTENDSYFPPSLSRRLADAFRAAGGTVDYRLLPAFGADPPVSLWPFEGGLRALLAPGRAVLAEVYPAEALRQCGLRLLGSKRAQGPRRTLSGEGSPTSLEPTRRRRRPPSACCPWRAATDASSRSGPTTTTS